MNREDGSHNIREMIDFLSDSSAFSWRFKFYRYVILPENYLTTLIAQVNGIHVLYIHLKTMIHMSFTR